MKPLLIFLAAQSAFAQIAGTVWNGTTGKPVAGADVTLVSVGEQGMRPAGSAKSDGAGQFQFEKPAAGAHLVQTTYQDVTYSKMIQPEAPAAAMRLEVYERSRARAGIEMAQHMILLEPIQDRLQVSETYILRNGGKTTYQDPSAGALRFALPPGAEGKVRVQVTAPNGMPIQRAAGKTSQDRVYAVDYPLKPGDSRFDLEYSTPLGDPPKFETSLLEMKGPTRLVTPRSVKLMGETIELLGAEPQSGANIYEAKAREISVSIEGMGALSGPPAQGEPADEEAGPKIERIKPKIYDGLAILLSLMFLLLGTGFVLQWRRGRDAPDVPAAKAPPRR